MFCVQELNETDIPRFVRFGENYIYAPVHRDVREDVFVGVGIFSRLPLVNTEVVYYRGDASRVPDFDPTSVATKYTTQNAMVVVADVEIMEGVSFRIATTHFTWTPDGMPDDYQRTDAKTLLSCLKTQDPLILCGDMNAPRGGEIYRLFVEQYTDAVPPEHKTSLDINLHRHGQDRRDQLENKMVDYIFTAPPYTASGVELVSGVSDHMAIVATVEKS